MCIDFYNYFCLSSYGQNPIHHLGFADCLHNERALKNSRHRSVFGGVLRISFTMFSNKTFTQYSLFSSTKQFDYLPGYNYTRRARWSSKKNVLFGERSQRALAFREQRRTTTNIIFVNWTTHFLLFFLTPIYQNTEDTTESRRVRECRILRKKYTTILRS